MNIVTVPPAAFGSLEWLRASSFLVVVVVVIAVAAAVVAVALANQGRAAFTQHNQTL